MLRELRVRNYAVIDRLDLELPEGLVAFTGETGAGKSIIIGALALALGARAQPEQLRSGAGEIAVEARFEGPFSPALEAALRDSGQSAGDDLLVRRIVPAGGKSRAYVNDAAAAVATLERIGRELVDIHGQHQHQSLLRPETHLDFLDGFAGSLEVRRAVRDLCERRAGMLQERARLAALEGEKERKLDFLAFQRREIESAALEPGEEERLEKERDVLRHAERLAAAALEADTLIYSGDGGAAGSVARAAGLLSPLAGIDPALAEISRLLEECQSQLEEAGREVQAYHGRIESNPDRLQELEDRLAQIRSLKRKFGESVEAVLEKLREIREEIALHETGKGRIDALDREIPALERELASRAGELSGLREKGRRTMEKGILSELKLLNLKESSFRIDLVREEDPREGIDVGGRKLRVDERGLERVEFLLAANPGEDLKALAKIVSGGELSRIMLAIKTVLAGVDRVPTLIFDEVDIGIGGKVARLVGERLAGLAAGRQVLCVTHLPQIASLAQTHYNISKSMSRKKTVVGVRRLDEAGRLNEIARMLGGRRVTEATRRHAAELLATGG